MSRPRPLEHIATGRPLLDHQSLTPRTPHSRAGRAEQAWGGYGAHQYEEDDLGTYQLQSEPLLIPSADESYSPTGYQEPANDQALWSSIERLPEPSWIVMRTPLLLGIVIALILFVLAMISFEDPDVLFRLISTGNNDVSLSTHGSITIAQDDVTSLPSIPHSSHANVISYENYTQFPLLPNQYAAECNKIMGGFMHHGKYWAENPKDVYHPIAATAGSDVCSSTITYQLGGQVGLFADLGLMAQVAGMARERNKTFLVDDTYWNRGSWTDYFEDIRTLQPGLEPGCIPPPPEELAACPRTARHWIVTARTAQYHLGHTFVDNYVNAYGHELNRLKPIFGTTVKSFSETIRPNSRSLALIKSARDELSRIAGAGDYEYIGLHLRRGDRYAISWRYRGGYVPVSEFSQAVNDTLLRLFTDKQLNVPLYIASDSPIAEAELVNTLPSSIATLSLSRSTHQELNEVKSRKEYVQKEFNELNEEERIRLTRGAVVDIAMLSGMWAPLGDPIPRATICTLTSSICKLSAVGLGWDRAFGEVDNMGNIDEKNKGWVEIDNASQIDPVWEAFELFN